MKAVVTAGNYGWPELGLAAMRLLDSAAAVEAPWRQRLRYRFFAVHSAFRALRRNPMAAYMPFRYSTTIAEHVVTTDLKESIMNALKHMEAIFVVAAAVALSVTFATTETKPLTVAADPVVSVQGDAPMPVVTIAAKRLTAAEKAALI
ncbi:hypothetical protein E7V67_008535 [[Empedobacter] haloabium]|uniref:ESPR domain-containing protein n=1 Tax=[Empedobacter] haloabium TaxID=592317 RepID=A0ABZ1USP0_9BURK